MLFFDRKLNVFRFKIEKAFRCTLLSLYTLLTLFVTTSLYGQSQPLTFARAISILNDTQSNYIAQREAIRRLDQLFRSLSLSADQLKNRATAIATLTRVMGRAKMEGDIKVQIVKVLKNLLTSWGAPLAGDLERAKALIPYLSSNQQFTELRNAVVGGKIGESVRDFFQACLRRFSGANRQGLILAIIEGLRTADAAENAGFILKNTTSVVLATVPEAFDSLADILKTNGLAKNVYREAFMVLLTKSTTRVLDQQSVITILKSILHDSTASGRQLQYALKLLSSVPKEQMGKLQLAAKDFQAIAGHLRYIEKVQKGEELDHVRRRIQAIRSAALELLQKTNPKDPSTLVKIVQAMKDATLRHLRYIRNDTAPGVSVPLKNSYENMRAIVANASEGDEQLTRAMSQLQAAEQRAKDLGVMGRLQNRVQNSMSIRLNNLLGKIGGLFTQKAQANCASNAATAAKIL